MKKFLNYWLIFIVLIFSFFQAPNFNITLQQIQTSAQDTGILEEDFFNTMFLKSEFFENWSDTNYFINPTLKTSKPLKYKKNWYLDFLRDTYSTGIVLNQPSKEFMYLYQNWMTETELFFGSIWDDNGSLVPWYRGSRIKKEVEWVWRQKANFLNFLLVFMQKVIASGMKVRSVYGSNIPKFYGWDDATLKFYADQWDSRLVTFDYYTYHPFKDYKPEDGIKRLWIDQFARQITMSDYPDSIIDDALVAKAFQVRSSFINFLKKYSDIILDELIRVQNGGSPDYDNISQGTEKVLFSFQIVDVTEVVQTSIYQMTLTIDSEEKIRAGTLVFFNKQQKNWIDNRLNFEFSFVLDGTGKYFTTIKIFSYEKGKEVIYSDLTGYLNLDLFLDQFFSNALVPIFENRSTFIESGYINNLEYNTVMLNFFGLKNFDFVNLLIDRTGKIITDFNNLMQNILTISKDFYKNYIRSLFDINANTYVQGYNREYGLIANNGFKIYPQYFYYYDKYKFLRFDLYSSYNNRFYQTKYGQAFNFDYSVSKSFTTSSSDSYIFDDDKRNEYHFKFQPLDSRSVGYNVFTLAAQKEGNLYRYYDFNFGIYNWQEITKDGLFPAGQWWQAKYESCAWYNITCHIKNAVIWIVNNIPGVKQGNELANGVGYIFKTTYEFFDQIFAVWKFSPALYNTVTNVFLLIIFMKLVRVL